MTPLNVINHAPILFTGSLGRDLSVAYVYAAINPGRHGNAAIRRRLKDTCAFRECKLTLRLTALKNFCQPQAFMTFFIVSVRNNSNGLFPSVNTVVVGLNEEIIESEVI